MKYLIKIRDLIYYQRKVIVGIMFIAVLLLLSLFFNKDYSTADSSTNELLLEENSEQLLNENVQVQDDNIVTVDIKGCIVKPGVYSVENNKRINDVIVLAGGLTSCANTNNINLSKRVEDEMVIVIDDKNSLEGNSKLEVNSIQNDKIKDTTNNKDEKVSINTASKEELMTLNGIGEVKAEAIIKYRKQNGNFKSLDEIMLVSGIGEKAFAKIKENIKL